MRKHTLFLFALVGCSAFNNPEPGALGNGKFGYTCTSQGFADASNFDTQCAPGVFTAPNFVPAAIAVGATFGVTYRSNKTVNGDDTVASGAPSIVALTGGHFETLRAGNVALIGMRSGVADDFEYVRIADVASIKVALQSTTSLAASPMSSDNVVLGGKLECNWMWSSSDPLVSIQSTGRTASVIGPAGNSATITATCGAHSGSLLVHLTGGTTDAGTGDGSTDASSDASDGGTNG